MIEFEKPNGTTIKVADRPENIALAKELGWVGVKPKRKAKA